MIKGILLKITFIAIALALAKVSIAQQALTLSDVLEATLESQSQLGALNDDSKNQIHKSFNWLDGTPTVALMYLHNQTIDGTREAEISLSLPIKSALRKQVENNLSSNILVVQASAKRQLALYYSGLIRTLVWDYELEKVILDLAKRKETVLAGLLDQYSSMAELNALPQYALYLLQKEANDSQILRFQHRRNTENIRSQYTVITGLRTLPTEINENLPEVAQVVLNNHPDIQALDASWDTFSQSLRGQRKSAQPWNIHLTAKRTESFNFSENQIGVGVDIPISLGDELSVTQHNEYLQAKVGYEVERQKVLIDLLSVTEKRRAEHQFLVQKQALLDAGASTLNALEEAINALLESNTENQTIHIRNLIDLIDAQGEITLNQIAIHQQIASIRQAAGLPL